MSKPKPTMLTVMIVHVLKSRRRKATSKALREMQALVPHMVAKDVERFEKLLHSAAAFAGRQ